MNSLAAANARAASPGRVPPDTAVPVHPPASAPRPLSLIGAFLRHGWWEQRACGLALVLEAAGVLITTTAFYFFSDLVDVRRLGGGVQDYFAFVIAGVVVYDFFSTGLQALPSAAREAQLAGGLEALFAAPVGLASILAGWLAYPLARTVLRMVLYIGAGAGIYGLRLPLAALPAASLALVLTALCGAALGAIGVAAVLVIERANPLGSLFGAVAWLLSGVLFPRALLPGWAQALAFLIPASHGLDAVRASLAGAPPSQLLRPLAALGVAALVLVAASLAAVSWACGRAREAGLLGRC